MVGAVCKTGRRNGYLHDEEMVIECPETPRHEGVWGIGDVVPLIIEWRPGKNLW